MDVNAIHVDVIRVDVDVDLVVDADVCVDETNARGHFVQAHDYDSDYV